MNGTLSRIMIVEDDPDIREIAVMALEDLGGFEVMAFASGADALERVEAVAPDLVLLDYMMAGMDGAEVLRRLRAEPATAGIPVVFVTAKASESEIERLRDMGAAAVITKPFDPMTLPDRVREICEAGR